MGIHMAHKKPEEKSRKSVAEHRSFEASAKAIYAECKKAIGATMGYIALVSADGKKNDVVHLDTGGVACAVDRSLPFLVRGPHETAYRTLRPVIENDFPHSPWAKFLPKGHAPLDNVLLAPLMIQGVVVGFLGFANKPGGFTEADPQSAIRFGELAAAALAKERV